MEKSGLTTAWQYDLNGRLIHREVSGTGGTVKEYGFVYDGANNLLWKNDTRYEYDELNQPVQELREEDLQSLLFPGKRLDEDTGLYYNARWYDPQTGRFITEQLPGLIPRMNFRFLRKAG